MALPGKEGATPTNSGAGISEISSLYGLCSRLSPPEIDSFLAALSQTRPAVAAELRALFQSQDNSSGILNLEQPAIACISDSGSTVRAEPYRNRLADIPKTPDRLQVSARSRLLHELATRWPFILINGLVLGVFVFSLILFLRHGNRSIDYGWDARTTRSGSIVDFVSAAGPASGSLRIGDRIRKVNGQSVDGVSLPAILNSLGSDAQYTIRVERNGAALDIALRNAVSVDERQVPEGVSFLFVSVALYAAAVLLSVLKPDGRTARFGYAALMLVALVTVRLVIKPYTGFLQGVALAVYALLFTLDGLHLAVTYHFYSVFFDELEAARRRDFFIPVAYLWATLVSLSRPVSLGIWDPRMSGVSSFLLGFVHQWGAPLYIAVPLGICSLILIRRRQVIQPDAIRRARWIVVGSLAGLLPYGIFRAVWLISLHSGGWFPDDARRTVRGICLLVVAVIPATTTYAVLKHRAFNISVVIHRGLQWLMLKGVLQTLVVLPGAGLLFTLVTNSQRTVAEALWHNTIFLSMVLLFGSMLVFRPRLTSWLERRFKLEFSACSRCNACYPFAEKCEADGEDLDPVPIDRDITRRYRPQCLLGRGGMGVVYRCQDLVLERPVAIKVIDVKDCATQTKLERALRESRAAARLNHPHIIVAHDLILDPGRAHIIMEYVPGDTLRTKLLKGRPDPRVAAIWFDQLLDGLSAAHDTGIVHRDLKPANIAIAEDSRGRPIVKILDFGIARLQGQMDPNTEAQATGELEALAETEPMLTRTGSVLGSFRYMSPEQINGGVADVRSDLFAVGLMIFEALTNESPFSGNTHVDRAKALKQPPRSLPAYSAADAELNRVLGKCLATDPPQRFQSAAEFRTNVIPLVAAYTGKPETKHAPAEASE